MNLLKSDEVLKIIEISKSNPNVITLVLFGSYAKGTQKSNSDIDLCIIRKKDSMPHDFEELDFQSKKIDIVFYDKLPDYIKFRIYSEGEILVLNNELEYSKIKKTFLHVYRDNYFYMQKQLNKQVAMI